METIGKYQIQKVLGRGGMGTVYEALDPVLHRKVAVKVMLQGLAETPDLRARFLREAQAAGSLRHRNVVTVYDLGEDKGQPYIAMEFIEGTDLEKIIQNKEPRALDWKIDVIRQICDGLAYAHRAGIVHRDVKPANIRVTPDNEVKIMDFGIAHLQSSTMTRSGLVLGTVHYMSPEQIEGQHRADHRADIFSVGTIAYELIAHRRPFEADSLTAVMFKITHEDADPSPLSNTRYSPGLEQTIMKALARDVANRYQRLDDMYSDLERLLRGETQTGPAPPASQVAPPETHEEPPRDEAQELRTSMRQALAGGQLQKALGLCKRLLEVKPDDAEAAKVSADISNAMRDREVEDLCRLALSYASDGESELAEKIAARIEKLAPESKRLVQLSKYLKEEKARRQAEALTGAAREHLALGHLAEAVAAAEEALAVYPQHTLAKEIRDRTRSILAVAEKRATGLDLGAPDSESSSEAPEEPMTKDEAPPAPPQAQPPAPEVPKVQIRPRAATQVVPFPARMEAQETEAAKRDAPTPLGPADPEAQVQSAQGHTSAPTPESSRQTKPEAPSEVPKPDVLSPAPRPEAESPAPKAEAESHPPRSEAPPQAPAPASPREKGPLPLTPLPEGDPKNADAARLLESARRQLRERSPQKALPLLEEAAALEPSHAGVGRLLVQTRSEARRAEIESLTSAALDAFVKNNYGKAKTAVEKALALDPRNRKAQELQKILGAIG